MDEFQHGCRFRVAGQLLAQPVFDGFYVVVGGSLDVLDRLGIGLTEVFVQGVQLC